MVSGMVGHGRPLAPGLGCFLLSWLAPDVELTVLEPHVVVGRVPHTIPIPRPQIPEVVVGNGQPHNKANGEAVMLGQVGGWGLLEGGVFVVDHQVQKGLDIHDIARLTVVGVKC